MAYDVLDICCDKTLQTGYDSDKKCVEIGKAVLITMVACPFCDGLFFDDNGSGCQCRYLNLRVQDGTKKCPLANR